MSRRVAYDDYLRSDRWQLIRKQALARAGHRCQNGCCPLASLRPDEIAEWYPREQSRLEVHHLTYERLGNEAPGDLLVLCGLCHSAVHGQSRPEAGPVSLSDAMTHVLQRLRHVWVEAERPVRKHRPDCAEPTCAGLREENDQRGSLGTPSRADARGLCR